MYVVGISILNKCDFHSRIKLGTCPKIHLFQVLFPIKKWSKECKKWLSCQVSRRDVSNSFDRDIDTYVKEDTCTQIMILIKGMWVRCGSFKNPSITLRSTPNKIPTWFHELILTTIYRGITLQIFILVILNMKIFNWILVNIF